MPGRFTPDPIPDHMPTIDAETLVQRASMLGRVRSFFAERGYLEVETPALSQDVCIDAHIDPIVVANHPTVGTTSFLQSSPEFAMKRLLRLGLPAIMQIAKAFRAGESGPWHNPEFTMIEWYRTGLSFASIIEETLDLCQLLLGQQPVRQTSYQEAFITYAQLDPWQASLVELQDRCASLGVADPPTTTDDCLNAILGLQVEPRLGQAGLEVLYHYPASQAALAQTTRLPDGRDVAERFEIYYHAIELANGFLELLDADILRTRNQHENERRVAMGKESLPIESRLLSAMSAGLPACSGVAVGFDRLVMFALGKTSIEQVIAFPASRA